MPGFPLPPPPPPKPVVNKPGKPGAKSPDSPNYQPGAPSVTSSHDPKTGVTSFHVAPPPRPSQRAGRRSPTPVRTAAAAPVTTPLAKKGTPGKANPTPTATKGGGTGGGGSTQTAGGLTAGNTYTPLSPAQLAKYAAQIANSEIAPQISGIQGDITTANEQAAQHAQAVAGFSKAMASLLAPIGGNITNAYGNAADAVASYGQGFSSDNTQLKQDAGANASTADPGMTAAQQAEIAKGYAGTPYDVMYGLNGYDPATSLRQLGTGLGALSDKLPAVASAYGQQWLGASQADALKNLQTLQKQEQTARAQYPTLYQTAMQNLHSQANQDQSLALTSAAAAGNLTGYYQGADGQLHPTAATQRSQATLSAAANKVNPTISGKYGVQMNSNGDPILRNGKAVSYPLSSSGAKASAVLSKAYGVLMGNDGSPILHDGKMVPYPTGGGKSFSAVKIQSYHGVASAIAQHAFEGYTDPKTGTVYPPISLGAAMQEMRATSVGQIPPAIAKAELARWYNPVERKRLQGK